MPKAAPALTRRTSTGHLRARREQARRYHPRPSLWPAESGAGYCYDDLRCAWGFADDVLKTFRERGDNISMSTQSLKLRHLMSWIDGGYNTVGSTTAGMLKALTAVVQADPADRSEEMAPPLPRVTKTDGDARA